MILANRKLLTRNQAVFYRVLRDAALASDVDAQRSVVIGVGETGAGKSYVASRVGMELLVEKKVDKMVFLVDGQRVDGQRIDDRVGLIEHTSNAHLKFLLREKMIEIVPFYNASRRTFSNAYVVADDAQNTTVEQMKTLLTRIDSGCQLVITGNHMEGNKKNGLANLMKRIALSFEESDESSFSVVQFTDEDIKRSELTRKIIKFYQHTDDLMTDGGRYL